MTCSFCRESIGELVKHYDSCGEIRRVREIVRSTQKGIVVKMKTLEQVLEESWCEFATHRFEIQANAVRDWLNGHTAREILLALSAEVRPHPDFMESSPRFRLPHRKVESNVDAASS
jgi:hypothetical protein